MSAHRRIQGCMVAILLLAGVMALAAQTTGSDGLAPQIPSYRRPLELFVRERLVAITDGKPLRVVRYGKTGDLEEPGSLDLPLEGRSLEVEAFDWIVAGDRAVEIRRLDSYDQWFEIEPASQTILIDENHAELVYGGAILVGDEAYNSNLQIGDVSVRGNGRARLRRDAESLLVEVDRGRFEVSRDGSLRASLGAGQRRQFDLNDRNRADPTFAAQRYDTLVTAIEDAIFDQWSPDALVLEGSTLVPIWESTRSLLPLFGRAASESAQWIDSPDIWERRIGEALRILAAYSFGP